MTKLFGKSVTNSPCIKIIYFLVTIALLNSCISARSTNYLKNENSIYIKEHVALGPIEPMPSRIQPDDILAVIVKSLSEETDALFNYPNTTIVPSYQFPGGVSSGGNRPIGYPVDQEGNVNLPLVGKIKLAGMTLKEADSCVTVQITQFVKDPSVDIRLLNQKFTIFGEVTRPGVYTLPNNRTSVIDVLSMTGDLTSFGRRDNVTLIRTVNNRRELVKLDLTSQQVLNSPYYFIENNDVVYVESRPGKYLQSERAFQLVPFFIGITAAGISLVSLLFR